MGLAILTRLASRFGFSMIRLYLLAGPACGNGGLVSLRFNWWWSARGIEPMTARFQSRQSG